MNDRGDKILKKWAITYATLAVVLAGCGGSSVSNGNGGTKDPGTGPAATGPVVTIGDKPGQIELAFLTGQGRISDRALGSLTATVGLTTFTDSIGSITQIPQLKLDLGSFTNQIVRFNVPFSGQQSRVFETFPFNFDDVSQEQGDGSLSRATAITGMPVDIATRVRVFPGRFTSLPVYVDDSMFTFTLGMFNTPSTATFDLSLFDTVNNIDVSRPRLASFLSDYLSFPIKGVAAGAAPKMSDGQDATRLYLSGDGFALSRPSIVSAGTGTDSERGTFEFISQTLGTVVSGRMGPPGSTNFPTAIGSNQFPGTYSLIQLDPTDVTNTATITSLQGIWREYSSLISNMGTSVAITFPSSRDDSQQDLIVLTQDVQKDAAGNPTGYQIRSVYYGFVNLETQVFFLYPITNLNAASTANQMTGTVSNLLTRDGINTVSAQLTRKGTLNFTTAAPGGVTSPQNFVVFRR